MKFENFLLLVLVAIMSVALFYFGKDQEIVYLILGAFIGGFNSAAIKDKDKVDE